MWCPEAGVSNRRLVRDPRQPTRPAIPAPGRPGRSRAAAYGYRTGPGWSATHSTARRLAVEEAGGPQLVAIERSGSTPRVAPDRQRPGSTVRPGATAVATHRAKSPAEELRVRTLRERSMSGFPQSVATCSARSWKSAAEQERCPESRSRPPPARCHDIRGVRRTRFHLLGNCFLNMLRRLGSRPEHLPSAQDHLDVIREPVVGGVDVSLELQFQRDRSLSPSPLSARNLPSFHPRWLMCLGEQASQTVTIFHPMTSDVRSWPQRTPYVRQQLFADRIIWITESAGVKAITKRGVGIDA